MQISNCCTNYFWGYTKKMSVIIKVIRVSMEMSHDIQ